MKLWSLTEEKKNEILKQRDEKEQELKNLKVNNKNSRLKKRYDIEIKGKEQGFGSAFFFFADPDPDPGKNLHADPDPDPGGIRGRGLVVKGKMIFFLSFFHVSDDS